MLNACIMEYWLYLDDSGKFTNISDKHTLYGGILFDSKKRRDHFIKKFREKRKNITNKIEIKSHEIVKLYKRSIKNINKRANIEEYLAELRHANAVFLRMNM